MKGLIIATFLLLFLGACSSDSGAPHGRILVRNDSQDREYNIVEVVASGRSYTLRPGDSEVLPQKATRIEFSRAYKDHVKRYTVQCPVNIKQGIVIKLIDVHTGRLPGGCQTVSASR